MKSAQQYAVSVSTFVVLLLCADASSAQTLRSQLIGIGGPLGSPQAMAALAALTSLEVSTAPLGTSTGGFTFTFDPLLRTWKRSTSSFGPAFSERSLTTGKSKVSAGFNWLHAGYSSFGGQDLQNGDFRPAKNVRGFTPLPATSFSSLGLNLSSDTLVFFGHAGVTDDLDLGVAVPWIRVGLDAAGGLFSASGTNLFPSSIPRTTASGLGDIAVFGKYRVWREEEGGLALALELRLPTGDKESLRGLDVTRTWISGVWSRGGTVSPHANLGYVFWSDSVQISAPASAVDVFAKDEVRYAFGVEFEASPRATFVVDLVGRHLRHGGKVGYQTFTVGTSSIDALVALPEGLQQLSLAPGLKWNVTGSLLVTVNVLASLKNDGLRANVIPVIGVDWAF